MITVEFFKEKEYLVGFHVSGHSSGNDDIEGRLVCAAVSSVVIMVANGVTDVLYFDLDCVRKRKGNLLVKIPYERARPCRPLFDPLLFYLKGLANKYPDNIEFLKKVKYKFVGDNLQ